MSLRQSFKVASATSVSTIVSLGVAGYPAPIGILVGGTFVATAVVEVSLNPEAISPIWVAFGAALTAPGTLKIDIPVLAVRVRCSAFTSGTVVAGICASDVE